MRFRSLARWPMTMEKLTSIRRHTVEHGVRYGQPLSARHRELAPGSAVAHPPHRFTQEVGSAAGRDEPGHRADGPTARGRSRRRAASSSPKPRVLRLNAVANGGRTPWPVRTFAQILESRSMVNGPAPLVRLLA